MLVTLATRTFTPEPTAAALRLGALARALAAGGERVRVLTARLAPSVARDAGVDVRRGAFASRGDFSGGLRVWVKSRARGRGRPWFRDDQACSRAA